MINLHFHGRIKNRRAYEQFCEEVIDELFPRQFTKRDIDIHIKFSIAVSEGAFGWAGVGECEDEYTVEVGKVICSNGGFRLQTPIEIASTLAHELTHVRQYVRGELNAEMTRWKGQKVPFGPRGGVKIPYDQQPWEVEAYALEKELVALHW